MATHHQDILPQGYIRLDEAYWELVGLLSADRETAGSILWRSIRGEGGRLQVWTRTDINGEPGRIEPRLFQGTGVDARACCVTGRFRTLARGSAGQPIPEDDLPLFIRADDWAQFRAGLEHQRQGRPPLVVVGAACPPIERYSDEERAAWMRNCETRNGDNAHKKFKKDPRYDGTKQPEWRKEWKKVVGQSRGRPRKIR